ncbi:hypothetical protein HGRIS_010229 [Hohenbuehelia grisea]|uniref:AB hydrolase-1 domain-containing protein n=1 Tax=Hohenbuehelia grisea TaxID=104357 RepID=A0ABR3J534_9AGAR
MSMDPKDPSSFNHKTARLSTGRTYHFVDQIPGQYDAVTTPTLLCVHGFPDLWYGWRHQIGPWVKSGYRVVVPDMLGYGDTDKPFDASEYSTKNLCADLAALLDFIHVERAVVIGHDWGAFTTARFALWHPDRLLAAAIFSVPYTPPSKQYIPIQEVASRAPDFGYQVYFASQESTQTIDANLRRFVRLLFRRPSSKAPGFTKLGELKAVLEKDANLDHLDTLLTPEEFEYYLSEFRKGMNGPLNYYRTSKYRHDEEAAAKLDPKLRANLPVLCIYGSSDPTCLEPLVKKAHKFIPNQKDVPLTGCGHWIMLEAADQVTNAVLAWLNELQGPKKVNGKL